MTIKQKVIDNKELLSGMTLQQLFQWAKDNGYNSAVGFSLFKRALSEIGVNYDKMKKTRQEERDSEELIKLHTNPEYAKKKLIASVVSGLERAAQRSEYVNRKPASQKQCFLLAKLAVEETGMNPADLQYANLLEDLDCAVTNSNAILTSRKASSLIEYYMGLCAKKGV